jgi:hypothetical protein
MAVTSTAMTKMLWQLALETAPNSLRQSWRSASSKPFGHG